MIYLDTSVLAAYYLPEKLSSKAQILIQQNPTPVITELTQLEFYSALSIRVRTQTLSQSDAQAVKSLFESHLSSAYYLKKTLEQKHYQKARVFIGSFTLALKAPDSLHLAFAATEVHELITADKQLANNGLQVGVKVTLLS